MLLFACVVRRRTFSAGLLSRCYIYAHRVPGSGFCLWQVLAEVQLKQQPALTISYFFLLGLPPTSHTRPTSRTQHSVIIGIYILYQEKADSWGMSWGLGATSERDRRAHDAHRPRTPGYPHNRKSRRSLCLSCPSHPHHSYRSSLLMCAASTYTHAPKLAILQLAALLDLFLRLACPCASLLSARIASN